MKISAITMLIWFGLASTVMAQSSSKAASPGGSSKSQFSEIRSLVHELQGHTEKLRELLSEYRSLVGERPRPEGGSPEAKKAHEEQLERWNVALDRTLRRIDESHAAVATGTQRLDQAAKGGGQLPTALAKDVANAHNEAEAERTSAEQVLKSKPAKERASKRAKQKQEPEKEAPPIPDDL